MNSVPMPTENRSSNTEMVSELLPCPFCGQQDFLIERLDSDASVVICQGLTGPHEACLARGPVGVEQDEGEEQPGRDKAVELWNARAEQHQGEPVGYQQRTMTDRPGSQWTPWRECCDATRARYSQEVGQFNQHGIMREIRPVFASAADPGELERLRAELGEVKGEYDRSANKVAALRAQLAEAHGLLRDLGVEPDDVSDMYSGVAKDAERYRLLRERMHVDDFPPPHPDWSIPSEIESKRIDELCDTALSASAEPSAPVERDDFWSWLDSAYRDGSEGEAPKFTKYNMEVAYRAGQARAALERKP
ncbi:Lar family restriction alleviation protein [Pseudomonas mosselii]|uniref:Lar family restriction alleviation protein n=1 Tax=Pseudomonas mosselii TaxID=78327 RepID=A0ABX9ASW8_9PSED|nr:Lar family restriction alleviation protein [Pseudomonas mosselii]QZP24181.1 Lar family restriction alleviation protein [Pseudomonas mosselii]